MIRMKLNKSIAIECQLMNGSKAFISSRNMKNIFVDTIFYVGYVKLYDQHY
jgi:hypothetical protein